MKRSMILCLLATLAGCDGWKYSRIPDDSGGDGIDEQDQDGPLLTHTPVEDGQPADQEVWVTCTAVDPESGVVAVTLYYKQETSSQWDDVELRPTDDEGGYEGAIPADDVESGGIDYFLAATDREGNLSYLPVNATDEVYHFRLSGE